MFLPILEVDSEQLADAAIVCGDPRRAAIIANKLDNMQELAFAREYRVFTGSYKGKRINVVSHGVGSSGAAVCFEELIKGGVKKLIRVGTCGSYTKELPPGGLVISRAAVREEGLTKQLVPIGFPAIADLELTRALIETAKSYDGVIKNGITLSMDVFFTGVESFPHKKYQEAGVLAVEMENAALFTISSLRGVQAASILAVDGYADDDLAEVYDPHKEHVKKAVEREIEIALHTLTDTHS